MEVHGGSANEGCGEAPGHAHEEETERPAEDGGGGRRGGVARVHCEIREWSLRGTRRLLTGRGWARRECARDVLLGGAVVEK